MIAWNKKRLQALWMREQAEAFYEEGRLEKEHLVNLFSKYRPGFYTPNFFIRIGLALLSFLAISFGNGLLTIMVGGSENGFGIFLILSSLMSVFILEVFIREKQHKHSGVDDALIINATGSLMGGLLILFDLNNTGISLLILFIALPFVIRYAYVLAALVAGAALLAFVYFIYTPLGTAAKASAPFLLLILSLAIAIGAGTLRRKYALRHYRHCLLALQVLMLFAAYASGNYFIVRKLGEELMGISSDPSTPFAFGWAFWILTFGIPAAYLLIGILKRSAVYLRIGLLLIPAAVLTFRYYYHLLPAEIMMVLAGLFLIVTGYLLLRFLRQPRHGFTAEAPLVESFSTAQLEALVIAEGFKQVPAPAPDNLFQGGSSGGGGASGTY
jgi:hypothetical protein